MLQDPLSGRVEAVIEPINIAVTPQQTGGAGVPHEYVFDFADAATADYDLVMTRDFELTDVLVQKRGAAGGAANTVQVKNNASAITDAMVLNIADTTLARPLTIDDANGFILKTRNLRISIVKVGGNAACLVTVKGHFR